MNEDQIEEKVAAYMANKWGHYSSGSIEYLIYAGIYEDGLRQLNGDEDEEDSE